MSKLMRISTITAAKLESLSKLTGESKQKLMDQAIALYAYEQILKKANDQYSVLQKNQQAWQEMQEEQAEWDTTLTDGLDHD